MSTTEQPANPNKALWEKGDFTQIAASMRDSGEALIELSASTADTEVLDLGCGDGTTAIPAAQRGADVLGIDIASNLVDAGAFAPRASASPTAGSRRATRPTWAGSTTTDSISWSASSARCSHRDRSTSPRRWCG